MSAPARPRFGLSAKEALFLGLVILFWGAFVIVLGKDTSWDFRNYHWYAPYAFLNGRMGTDVVVAHLGTYYNPFLDIPFYLLATHTSSWIALGVLGMVQGTTVVPLYLIGRAGLPFKDGRLAAGALAVAAQFGAMTLTEMGTTYYDNVMALFVLSGLAILIVCRDTLRAGSLRNAALVALVAGFVTGSAFGLKLPQMPFCIGFAATLLVLGGSWKHLITRLIAGGIGGLMGFALFSVWWMLHMKGLTGNPLFPYFNEYWQSPLVLEAGYRDLRFVPMVFWRLLLFPVLFSIDWHVAGDLGFQDIRVMVAYFAVIAVFVLLLLRRLNRDPLMANNVAFPLFVFAAVTYLVWLNFFAIYRYILALEMLSLLLIVAAVGLFPVARRARYLILGVLGFAILVTARSDFIERAPLENPYVKVALPPISDPDRTMVLMTGDAPLGFIAPSLPPQIPILRIDGWLVQPRDGTGLTGRMKSRVSRHMRGGGALYLVTDITEMERARIALRDYNLAIRWSECQQFDTNLVGTYHWCPLARRT